MQIIKQVFLPGGPAGPGRKVEKKKCFTQIKYRGSTRNQKNAGTENMYEVHLLYKILWSCYTDPWGLWPGRKTNRQKELVISVDYNYTWNIWKLLQSYSSVFKSLAYKHFPSPARHVVKCSCVITLILERGLLYSHWLRDIISTGNSFG